MNSAMTATRWYRPTLEELRRAGLKECEREYGPFATFAEHRRREMVCFGDAEEWRKAMHVDIVMCNAMVREPNDP